MKLLAIAVAMASSVPCSAQWSTDSLSEARFKLAATSVGSIAMFAGGRSAAGFSSVVDVYNAATGAWSTANLSQPRDYVSAASAGGLALFSGLPGDHIDMFDAATGLWTTTSVPFGLPYRAATSVGDKVLFGGGGFTTLQSDRVDLYDTTSGTWSVHNLSQARTSIAATSVGNLAIFAGGCISTTGCTAVSTVDIFDASTSAWSTAMLSEPRTGIAATSVGGKALFAGGGFNNSDRVDIYDSATGTWSQASLSMGRQNLTATTSGRFAFFAGGWVSAGSMMSDRVDIYDSQTDTWSTSTLSEPRAILAATRIGDRALFAGGQSGSPSSGFSHSAVVDVFDGQLGTAYCLPQAANSSGLPGLLSAEGDPYATAGPVTLIAEQLPPGQFGYFITSLTQGFVQPIGSQGAICLSANIGRYNRASEIVQGPSGSLVLDLASMPVNPPRAVLPGDTWNFQCWYRDVNPGPTSNTTNGLAVTFRTPGAPSVQFAVTQGSVVEDATVVEVLLTLSQPTARDVLVPYTTGGTATVGVDWRVEELNPFVIPAGETRAEMTLVIAEDPLQEPDETAIVSLGAPIGAVLGTQTTFTLTIVNDD